MVYMVTHNATLKNRVCTDKTVKCLTIIGCSDAYIIGFPRNDKTIRCPTIIGCLLLGSLHAFDLSLPRYGN